MRRLVAICMAVPVLVLSACTDARPPADSSARATAVKYVRGFFAGGTGPYECRQPHPSVEGIRILTDNWPYPVRVTPKALSTQHNADSSWRVRIVANVPRGLPPAFDHVIAVFEEAQGFCVAAIVA